MVTFRQRNPERLLKYLGKIFEFLPAQYWESLFFGALLAYTVALIYQAFQFSGAAGLFPLIVGIPLAVLLTAKTIMTLFFKDRIRGVGGLTSNILADKAESAGLSFGGNRVEVYRELESTLWVCVISLLIWLIGFLPGLATFIFGFMTVKEQKPIRAMIVTSIVMTTIYLLFVELLSIRLWNGIVVL
ncbi:Tripartite tricarboxylate transporter TctB family protein [Halopenitus malekzadehii]|uniref:Tripartite tricarboxylate transporter TctB family protein n=1 Tax=Halopenitus malekzadehii TaxID=1267564 RepID=A0A1H6JYE2_9EURY|nr:tripartite tricarboxylate transporter TctB family protein [Halopenitus malekzadehii]SEH64146.1 Tripartite tricarboxylate transporter TctB family protein [Halopenitus malekzadehii]